MLQTCFFSWRLPGRAPVLWRYDSDNNRQRKLVLLPLDQESACFVCLLWTISIFHFSFLFLCFYFDIFHVLIVVWCLVIKRRKCEKAIIQIMYSQLFRKGHYDNCFALLYWPFLANSSKFGFSLSPFSIFICLSFVRVCQGWLIIWWHLERIWISNTSPDISLGC